MRRGKKMKSRKRRGGSGIPQSRAPRAKRIYYQGGYRA